MHHRGCRGIDTARWARAGPPDAVPIAPSIGAGEAQRLVLVVSAWAHVHSQVASERPGPQGRSDRRLGRAQRTCSGEWEPSAAFKTAENLSTT